MNVFFLQDVSDRRRYVFVFMLHQNGRLLHDRYLASKSSEHLRKLNPDVPASNHNEVLRNLLNFKKTGVREIVDLVHARQSGNNRTATDVQKYLICGQN